MVRGIFGVVGGGRGAAFRVGLGVGDSGGVSPGRLGGRVIPGGTIGVIPAIGLRMSGGGKPLFSASSICCRRAG